MTITAAALRTAERAEHVDATWSVVTACRGTAVAHAVRRADSLEVRVGDGVTDSRGHHLSTAVATLRADCSLTVRTQAAPPALWVQSGGVWLLPSGADGQDPQLGSEDRLLLLSADTLEAEPSGLVGLLSMPADSVLGLPPDELLSLVLPTGRTGAAAVVWRSPGQA